MSLSSSSASRRGGGGKRGREADVASSSNSIPLGTRRRGGGKGGNGGGDSSDEDEDEGDGSDRGHDHDEVRRQIAEARAAAAGIELSLSKGSGKRRRDDTKTAAKLAARKKHFADQAAAAGVTPSDRASASSLLQLVFGQQEEITDADWERFTIRGTCTNLEKRYFRLIAASCSNMTLISVCLRSDFTAATRSINRTTRRGVETVLGARDRARRRGRGLQGLRV
jgi:hypothetical protein